MDHLKSLCERLGVMIVFIFLFQPLFAQQGRQALIRGSVKDGNGDPVEFATVYIKETRQGTQSDLKGDFLLAVAPGNYTFCVQMIGYETYGRPITVQAGGKMTIPVELVEKEYALQEVVVEAKSAVKRINESAYNAVALDATLQHNSTANLSGMLNMVSGVRIRENGGVGSEMQVMMDGFSGKHVKVFVDGVPQDGVGQSFGLNNIPVNFAERIEVYKGVVPVEFGTDAIGGVINIVTKKSFNKKWHLDASYSYGSFNTHKSYVDFGQASGNGLVYEVNMFRNYSDNNYHVDTPVKEFLPDGGSSTDRSKVERVKRFHDAYHNEAVTGKVGLAGKAWADRLLFGIAYSQAYKELQNGVRQEVVFGGKYRKGRSVMPSLEYRKRDMFVDGLDVALTANYNKNITHNADTSSCEFNWRGEKRPRAGTPGEQSYMHLRSDNNNWNGTVSAHYRLKDVHSFTFNHVANSFRRSNRSLLTPGSDPDPIAKETRKNISGLSYQFMPGLRWNVSLFGKYYHQHVAGPVATSSSLDKIVKVAKTTSTTGYGMAGTCFVSDNLQVKISYEKVCRLPANDEMFGDEDLETGDIAIRPEKSHNANLNVVFDESFGKHAVYMEGGLVYRDIKDYIRRNITGLSGGRYGAAYVNHGRALTKGYTLTARYHFSNLLSVGGNLTGIDTRDNVATDITGAPSNTYKARLPNIPYLFANTDIAFHCHGPGAEGNVLTVSYDNSYVKGFPLYSEALGSRESKSVVPGGFSHNVSVSYSMKGNRYNISFECRNLANGKLYDNFSLQKAGRAFYGKLRVSL